MNSADLIRALRDAGDLLHLAAADALTAAIAQEERLRARLKLIEGVARLNGETIRGMQRAAIDAARTQHTGGEDVRPGGCMAATRAGLHAQGCPAARPSRKPSVVPAWSLRRAARSDLTINAPRD